MKYVSFFFALIIFASCGKKTSETTVIRKDVNEIIFASGSLEPDNSYNLTAQTEGYLVQFPAEEGMLVKPGDLLAVIDNQSNSINAGSAEQLYNIASFNTGDQSPQLIQASQNKKLAQEKYRQDSLTLQRYQKLFSGGSISKLELENAQLAASTSRTSWLNSIQSYETARQLASQQLIQQDALKKVNSVMRGNNEIRAVVGGKIYRRYKEAGDYVRKGDVIARIGNADTLFAKVSVDESNISRVKLGMKAVISLNTDKTKKYNGEVFEILPAFDESTQSFTVKIRFGEKPAFAISGTQLQVNMLGDTRKNVLVIPRQYLGYGNKVMLKGKESRTVTTGFVSDEWVEITSGLSENEAIMVEFDK